MRFDERSFTHPKGADLQFDVSPADWIAPRLLPWGRDLGTRVCSVVPVDYEAYVRVFHRAEELVGTTRVRRRWAEIAERTGRTMHPTVQFTRFEWPDGPHEGQLDREEATSLVKVLRRHTSTPGDCWLAIWDGYGEFSGSVGFLVRARPGLRGWLNRRRQRRRQLKPPPGLADAPTVSLPSREYYLYRAPIDVVPRFEFRPPFLQTPNMWWPHDRAWFVGTEIDSDSTLVACSRPCAEELLNSELEALEVSSQDRLDIDGDRINPRL